MKRDGLLRRLAAFGTLLLLACCTPEVPAQGRAIITLDEDITYQVISGWEATAQAGQTECADFPSYKDELFDLAVNDLGINRLRLEVRSGAENRVDSFTKLLNGAITEEAFAEARYKIVNDDDDPLTINPAGFHFSELDHTVESVVLPLKQMVERNGEHLHLNVTYVDFDTSTGTHHQNPEEYAEFVLAAYQHLHREYGWVPDSWEVILEPDNSRWSGEQIGRAIVASANRLIAHGFHPRFVAPSNTDMGSAISYFDDLIQIPGAIHHLGELSYHRYRGVSDENLRAIAGRAERHGIDTAMLEHIGSDYQDLHRDLILGRNSSWQQFTLAYCTPDNGAQYYVIDNSISGSPSLSISERAKFLRHYFKYVRAGAVRIEAASSSDALEPVSFINEDGGHVVVVKANNGGQFAIEGLPAGEYGIVTTTTSQVGIESADVTLSSGQPLPAEIPDAGVITIYAREPKPEAATGSPRHECQMNGSLPR